MSSSSSRRSFYPLPPSVYPVPSVDPCPAMETTYSHNHCAHTLRDSDFYRSRTFNPASSRAQAPFSPTATGQLAHAAQGIYPKHGIGQYVIPYYRRDSKGFRRPFTQPASVDEQYSATRDLSGLAQSGWQWAHPSSRAPYTYSARQSGEPGGAMFSPNSTHSSHAGMHRGSGAQYVDTLRSRSAREVAQGLQLAQSQRIEQEQSWAQSRSGLQPWQTQGQGGARPQSAYAAPGGFRTGAAGSSFGGLNSNALSHSGSNPTLEPYYTDDVRDRPPPGAEIEVEQQSPANPSAYGYGVGSPSSSGYGEEKRSATPLNDPLLSSPLDNAKRKARTVYKRAYGHCQ